MSMAGCGMAGLTATSAVSFTLASTLDISTVPGATVTLGTGSPATATDAAMKVKSNVNWDLKAKTSTAYLQTSAPVHALSDPLLVTPTVGSGSALTQVTLTTTDANIVSTASPVSTTTYPDGIGVSLAYSQVTTSAIYAGTYTTTVTYTAQPTT